MIRIRVDKNGWITAIGSGLSDYDYTYEGGKDIALNDPSKEQQAWHWNGGDPELRETGASPEGEKAKKEIRSYLYSDQSDFSTNDDVADFLDKRSSLMTMIQDERYQVFKKRSQTLVNRGEVTQSDRDHVVNNILKL